CQFGLVVTNWHVVRDGQGDVEVVFPDGFRSKARPLKVDADWDLAALVIWRPEATPVPIAPRAPRPGERLTICGYGQGQYRAVTGRCTQYYAPRVDLPQHMVELDVEARQGDSGGPIFNEQGELAGVLFGAGGGTTMGSFGGQVEWFLATLAPDIGRPRSHAMAATGDASPLAADLASGLSGPPQGLPANAHSPHAATPSATAQAAADEGVSAYSVPADGRGVASDDGLWSSAPAVLPTAVQQPTGVRGGLVQLQTMLAAIGALALAAQVLRAAR
ncbi:MAG TPA: serine protease, partial [Lacipirellulaceae bacterium]|nr:serine protease [Lacipirellulaceae bacterium]